MSNTTPPESEQREAANPDAQTPVNTEAMTLEELLDHRYSLPMDERSSIKVPGHIASNHQKMFLWSFQCIYQDKPVLVILAGSVLIYHALKLAIDVVKSFF